MKMQGVPYSSAFDLGSLHDRAAELVLKPTAAERVEIAHWLEIEAVESLEATVRLSRLRVDEYEYQASFEADVVQACVVTLDPVRGHLSGEFHRTYRLAQKLHSKRRPKPVEPPVVALLPGDEDEPERLESPIVDVAAPGLEELRLAAERSPGALGAAFDAPPDEVPAKDRPFAVLEKLKKTASQSSGSTRSAKPKP